MIHSEVLKNYFEIYSESELVYRRYHEILADQAHFPERLQALRQEIIEKGARPEDYWWPEVNPMQNPEAVRDLWYPFDDDIVVAKHMRYHPLFKHVHGFYEMIYVLSGTGYNYMDGTSFAMTDGSVCIIPPDVSHAIGIFDDSVIANILIKKSAFDRTFSKFLSEENILSSFLSKSLRGGRAYRYLFFPAGSEKLNRILEALLLEGVVKDEYSSPLKKTLLLEAFYCLLREQRDIAGLSEYDEPNAEILYAIRNYIRDRFQEVTLKDTAAHFNYSVPYLSRLIKQSTGYTFTDMLREVKLSKACEMLARSDKKVSEISDILGYDAPVYFSRVFKKHMGMTPAEYRRNYAVPLKRLLTGV